MAANYSDISISEYQAQFETADNVEHLLLDVREVDEFSEARIPGAVNLPLSEFMARYNDEVPTDKPIVLVCAAGGRSAQAAGFLAAHGYTQLYNLIDGTMGWVARGLPVDSDT